VYTGDALVKYWHVVVVTKEFVTVTTDVVVATIVVVAVTRDIVVVTRVMEYLLKIPS